MSGRTYLSVTFPSIDRGEAARLVETIVSLLPGECVNVHFSEPISEADLAGEAER